jgi:hypothetical protein
MKLIDKIIAYCRKVEKAERPKQSDKEEYSHGKYAVASSVLKLVELNQPEPPTLRPISEAKAGYDYLFLLQSRRSPDIYHWRTLYVMNEFRLYGQGGANYEFNRANLEGNRVFKLIGWHPLPPIDKMQLPKTNEIKPC